MHLQKRVHRHAKDLDVLVDGSAEIGAKTPEMMTPKWLVGTKFEAGASRSWVQNTYPNSGSQDGSHDILCHPILSSWTTHLVFALFEV